MVTKVEKPDLRVLPLAPKNPLPYRQQLKAVRSFINVSIRPHTGNVGTFWARSGRAPSAGTRCARRGGLAVAIGLGVAAATGYGVACADTAGRDSTGGSVSHSGSPSATGTGAPTGASSSAARTTPAGTGSSATGHGSTAGPQGTPASASTRAAQSGSAAPQQGSPTTDATVPALASTAHPQVAAERGFRPNAVAGSSAQTAPPPTSLVGTSGAAQPTGFVRTATAPAATAPTAAHTALTTTTSPVAATVSTTVNTAPSDPAPESPIAAILALPGRIANVVLEFLGLQEASGTTPAPISPAPLFQLLWAAVREIENVTGLNRPPPPPPALPSETFTGSLTTPTPTVAQLLDASEAAYGLGTTPGGGLTPFTVNGLPVTYTNDLTGTYAQVWVTPQNQIVIAYQGTTGGTNLLFNPLIAVTQVLEDLQGTFFPTTTDAVYTDALSFAQRVEAQAAAQGYSTNNIFVTGHSLGAGEAEYVAQHTGLGGIGFEDPGLNTTADGSVPGNGANSLFVNTATYGDSVPYIASDLPGEQPFAPAYVPAGGSEPHYGPIVLLGNPSNQYQLTDTAALWGTGPVGDLTSLVNLTVVDLLQYHLPNSQAYNLGVNPEPTVLPISIDSGPTYDFADDTIPEFLQSASADGILVEP